MLVRDVDLVEYSQDIPAILQGVLNFVMISFHFTFINNPWQ